MKEELTKKPDDWPINETEIQLESISKQIEKFIENPTNENREVLISMVSNYDLNQNGMRGLFRTTQYEVSIINTLYFQGSLMGCRSIISFLYDLVERKTQRQKMVAYMTHGLNIPNIGIEIEAFEDLVPPLKFCYLLYQKFTIDKDKRYADKIIDFVEENLNEIQSESENVQEYLDTLTRMFIGFLNDISYIRSIKRNRIWAFNRKEVYKLFSLAAKLLKMIGRSAIKKPERGVLMTALSNYILKSRYNYNEDYVCKYVSPEVAYKSVENKQIWMSIIENLNDSREKKVVPELFENREWIHYKWVKNLDFTLTRNYYVSSFSKSINSEKMKEMYGSCTYGYKDDRVAELIAPIYIKKSLNGEIYPFFSQVISFDVLYNKEQAKEELNFLFSIIDLFDLKDEEKKEFLEYILQYWILSVKDEFWSYEREHRYVIFMYEDYEYRFCNLSDKNFLKTETTIFMFPDFVLGDNPTYSYLKEGAKYKRTALSIKPYLFCETCLNSDYDAVIYTDDINEYQCAICGSKKVVKVTPGKNDK